MIDVTIYCNEMDEVSNMIVYGFDISGHAGFAEYGKDIVCAGISALSINTVNSIQELTNNIIDVEMKDEGFLKLLVDNPDDSAKLILRSFVLGMKLIFDEYGQEYIHINYKEV